MATIIDAHQHVWDLGRSRYDWLTPDDGPLYRTIEFDEVRPSLIRASVDGTVLVQSADTYEDTALMRSVAATNPEVVGIVGFLPLDRPAEVAAELDNFAFSPVVGVRNLIHNIPDPQWLLRPDVDESLGMLERIGLTFDLVSVLPEHLALVPTMVDRHPNLRIVIDHLSKPPIGTDAWEPWSTLIAHAAESPTVYAKVSGLYSSVGDSASWSPDLIRPYLLRALEVFGPTRLMYGGDWPISILSGGYDRVWDGLTQLFDELESHDRDLILGQNAIDFYNIDPALLEAAKFIARGQQEADRQNIGPNEPHTRNQ